MHHVMRIKLVEDLNGPWHVQPFTLDIDTRVCMGVFSAHQGFTKLKSLPTHPPHVLVSAKVLYQSRRAKGGFFIGAVACYA
jgi:hypothetical protein